MGFCDNEIHLIQTYPVAFTSEIRFNLAFFCKVFDLNFEGDQYQLLIDAGRTTMGNVLIDSTPTKISSKLLLLSNNAKHWITICTYASIGQKPSSSVPCGLRSFISIAEMMYFLIFSSIISPSDCGDCKVIGV